jgi:hypothetical protein
MLLYADPFPKFTRRYKLRTGYKHQEIDEPIFISQFTLGKLGFFYFQAQVLITAGCPISVVNPSLSLIMLVFMWNHPKHVKSKDSTTHIFLLGGVVDIPGC